MLELLLVFAGLLLSWFAMGMFNVLGHEYVGRMKLRQIIDRPELIGSSDLAPAAIFGALLLGAGIVLVVVGVSRAALA